MSKRSLEEAAVTKQPKRADPFAAATPGANKPTQLDDVETKANAGGAPQKLRGVALPQGWTVVGESLLVWSHLEQKPSAQIAAFDFDGCLAKTSFGGGPNDWKMMFSSVPKVLMKLHDEGKRIVIVTNESLDRLKKPEAISKGILKKIGRLEGFATTIGVPMLVLCATAKDTYRKPGKGAWEHLVTHCNGGMQVDLSSSFYVGDAAGRKGDHSDSDMKFAQMVGIRFHTEDSFFKAE